jgi:hypothetical protein
LCVFVCAALPPDETQFFDAMRTYFPNFYDIKVHTLFHLKTRPQPYSLDQSNRPPFSFYGLWLTSSLLLCLCVCCST